MVLNTRIIILGLGLAAAAALGMAYIAQYQFNLAPCILCLYQRVPFAIIAALGLLGYALNKYPRVFLVLIGTAYFANTVIAAYHTGVERKWWRSFIEGCSSPDLSGSIDDLMKRIEQAPVTACTDIAWADPVLGLSMANYNIVFCLFLGILAICALHKN